MNALSWSDVIEAARLLPTHVVSELADRLDQPAKPNEVAFAFCLLLKEQGYDAPIDVATGIFDLWRHAP